MYQEYEKYTPNDHIVWSTLYDRQMDILPEICTGLFLEGIKKCGFRSERVPNFEEVNRALNRETGWSVYVVPGLIDNKRFFEHLSNKEFPATTWLRSADQLDYLEEPDMFHDVFGHVPLLSNTFFSQYLRGLSDIILDHVDNPLAVEYMARIYWYTVEFGLLKEDGEIKIYGAGILSSPGESLYSVSDKANHLPYDVATILATPYIKDKFQSQYFVVDSLRHLSESLPTIRQQIEYSLEGS